jgi:hypothetical protein
MNNQGGGTTNETIIERLKREKRERQSEAQKRGEDIDQRKREAESRRAGRDTFDKDLDDISYDTLERLVNTSENEILLTLPQSPGKGKADRLRDVLGQQLSSVPDSANEHDFVAGYIERAKERWQSELKQKLED